MHSSRWQGLYKFGGVAALIIAVLMVGEVAVYVIFPRFESAAQHFALFHENWFAGLLTLDLLGMLSYLLFVPVILALYLLLHDKREGLMLVATALFFLGVADFFATNTAFPVLDLSNRYAAAATDAERGMYLAAGQAMLTIFNENAFLVSYVIVSAAWTMIAWVMLESGLFTRLTCYSGILAGASGILAVLLEHSLGQDLLFISIALYFAAIVFLFLWTLLLGRRLYQLGVGNAAIGES